MEPILQQIMQNFNWFNQFENNTEMCKINNILLFYFQKAYDYDRKILIYAYHTHFIKYILILIVVQLHFHFNNEKRQLKNNQNPINTLDAHFR